MRDRANTLALTIAITLVIAIVVVSFSHGMGSWNSADASGARAPLGETRDARDLLDELHASEPLATEGADAAAQTAASGSVDDRVEQPERATDASVRRAEETTLRVLGRCVDRFGKPLAGVTIAPEFRFRPDAARAAGIDADVAAATPAPVQSSQLGHFELALAPPSGSILAIVARRDDLAPSLSARAADRVAAIWNLGDIVLDSGVVVVGRVVDTSGAAVHGARVELLDVALVDAAEIDGALSDDVTRAEPSVAAVSTDPDGSFRWLRVPRGVFRIAARGAAEPSCRVLSPRLDATLCDVDAALDAGELVLPAATALEGLVVDEDGLPLAGVAVECVSNHTFGRVLVPPLYGRSATSGGFTLAGVPIGPRGARLTLRRDGHVTTRQDVATPSDGRVVVVLPRAGSVRGVVTRAEDGTALREFGVVAVAIDRDGFESEAAERSFSLAHAPHDVTRRGDDGGFLLGDLAPGRYRIVVAAPRRIATCSAPFTVRPTESPQLAIALPLGVQLHGRVLTADGGAPIEAAIVTVESIDPRSSDAPIRLRTDAAGRFATPTLPPAPNGMRIAADASGYVVSERHVNLRAGESAAAELRLERGASLFGRVDWLPAGARGVVRVREAATGRRCQGEIDATTASYRVDGLAPGAYFVELDLDGGTFAQRAAALFARFADATSPDFVIERAGADLRFDPRDPLTDFAVIEGAIEPRPPSGAVLRLRSTELGDGVLAPFQPRADIAADGRYRIDAIPPGRWLLELVDARGETRHSDALVIPRGSRIAHDVRWRRE